MFDKVICSDSCKIKNNKFKTIYQKCHEYLEEEFDIIRLIKS